MTRRLVDCSRCTLTAMTMPSCPECRGVGQYWSGPGNEYGLRPIDADGGFKVGAVEVTPTEIARVRELQRMGWRTEEIAARLRLSSVKVNRLSTKPPIRQLSDEAFALLWTEFMEGADPNDLSEREGLSKQYFKCRITRRRAVRLGLRLLK